MYKRSLLVIIIILFYSCAKDPDSSVDKKIDTVSNQSTTVTNKATNNNISFESDDIETILSYVPSEYRPSIINNYFNNNKNLLFNKNNVFAIFEDDNDSLNTSVYVQNLYKFTKQDILLFSIYSGHNNKFTNSFYLVRYMDYGWYPTTKLLISKSLIDFLTKKFNTTFFYKPCENTYRYETDTMNFPFYFDFSQQASIKIFDGSDWKVIKNLIYDEDIITIADNNESDSIADKQINLDDAPVYQSMNQALADSINVYILDLSSSYLSSISKNINKLSNLRILSINDNNLTFLPQNICTLSKLSVLRAENNQIKILPENIGNLVSLDELSLSNNKIISLPVSFYDLKNLKSLKLDNNELNIFEDFSKFTQLITCDLSNNNINKLPNNIDSLKSIISLDISNNPISSLPASIYKLKNLQYINIKGTQIPDNVAVRLFEINSNIRVDMN